MVGPWAYGVFEGRQLDRWLASRAGWRADVLRDRTIFTSHATIARSIFSLFFTGK